MHSKASFALAMHDKLAKKMNGRGPKAVLNGRQVVNLQYCHELISDTAKALAGELYAAVMRDNENFTTWKLLCNDLPNSKCEAEFIKLMWPKMLDDARATLSRMLGTNMNESLKQRIYHALILDGDLRKKGRGPKPLLRMGAGSY